MSDGIINKIQEALALMSSNSPNKSEALHYLEEFQKTSQAWEILHIILSNSNDNSIELKMFASQTLRNKTTYDLNQIPQGSLIGLKDSIIKFLIQYSEINKPIRTQLSIALAKLSIQFIGWNNSLDEIIDKLQPNNIPTLLEFLKILPEETFDPKSTPLTDEEFRIKTQELIVDNVPKVLGLLSNYAQSTTNSSAHSLILDCLNSWVREIPVEKLLTIEPLTNIIFESLQTEESFEKSIECLSTIVRETKDIENLQLIYALYQQIINLKPLLKQHKDDPEIFGSLTTLFVDAGETWHMLISKSPNDFKPLVEILLECTSYDEDLDIVKYTFYFWYSLKQMITLDRFKPARDEFKQIYTQLVYIMIHHLQYPDGSELEPLFTNKEEEEKFKDFRYDMGDVLKDCTAVIGDSEALIIPFEKIKSSLNNNNIKWQEIEAPLFSLRAMAKEVRLKENQILPQIMDLLIQLPENVKIRYAATLVLGRYTEWTSKHPEFLEKQLNYIINGFQFADNEIITAASHALMYFCQDCSKLLTNYIEQLYNFYLNIINSPIEKESLYEISEGISHIIDTQNSQDIQKISTMFFKPILDKLTSYIDKQGSDELFKSIAEEIEIIRIFIEFIKPRDLQNIQDPIANLIIEIWPLVIQLLNQHGHSMKVSERCMKFTKTILQSYNLYLIPILPSIAETLVNGFETTRFGCYLWVSGVVIKEFGDDYVSQETKDEVWKFAYKQITTFLQVFNQTSPIDISDLIEDFFRMMGDIVIFFVPNFILSDLLKPVFDIALLSLDLEKFEPLISTLHFLIDLISWGFDTPPISIYDEVPENVKLTIQQFNNSNGGLLIKAVLNGLIFKFPTDAHPDASDLITKTLKLSPTPEVAVQWINESLDSLPINTVTSQERTKLITTVSTALQSKDYRRIRTSLKDFVTWYSRKNISPRFQSERY
ncbi:hypothetical protein WICMUC_000823 [Wickerhamomyces mucosus]|uniref:Importin N-terminal domain-containing protein n=1 Tax=Wickerhamomyces mucosus TaxID=1378264 RepID=A0A9P8TI15_9ASCO|nr:hypothetical protein WICMUC_000823 [Wickerhamomyces mucosus]